MRAMNTSREDYQREKEHKYYTFPIKWQLAIIVPLVGVVCIIGLAVYLFHKKFGAALWNRTAVYRSRIANYSEGACISDVDINIHYRTEYQQRTIPLTAREPVPTTSPLYGGTQSTEGANKQNGSTSAAYYKKCKTDISGEEKYDCKHHQVVTIESGSLATETRLYSITNRVHHLSVWVTSESLPHRTPGSNNDREVSTLEPMKRERNVMAPID